MKYTKFILLLFLANLSIAQNSTSAKLKTVTQNGLHKIVLPPAIRSFSKQDLSDLRIYDAKKNEVPYFLAQSENEKTTNNFSEYKIVSKTVTPKKNTVIIIENPTVENYSQISLFIANSNAVKSYSIAGSDNQKDWFGLSNSQELFDLADNSQTYIVKTIPLPLTSYKFLKIELDDRKTLPLNILKAGNFKNQIQRNSLVQILPQSFTITQLSAKKETLIHIVFDGPQIINQVIFDISKPGFYKRNTVIYKNETRKHKHKTETYPVALAYFELNSATKNIFDIPEIFEKEFFIKIENQDNQPLTFSEVKCMQLPISIIADLNADENYIIKTGNPNLTAPQYDLSNFKNNISDNLPETAVYEIKKTANVAAISKKSFWQQAWFMWMCIIVGGIAVLFFTASLVKDMKTK
nr:hypothetical protein [uncultured Flavobacterium sp.]